MSERSDWIILGRVIGTATGWDQTDTFAVNLYNFEPANGVSIPAADCLSIQFEDGLAKIYSDDGKILRSIDIITAIAHLPRVAKENAA